MSSAGMRARGAVNKAARFRGDGELRRRRAQCRMYTFRHPGDLDTETAPNRYGKTNALYMAALGALGLQGALGEEDLERERKTNKSHCFPVCRITILVLGC
ncbi:hypothetical protein MRX96_038966 [Rhipicephalus microplus]